MPPCRQWTPPPPAEPDQLLGKGDDASFVTHRNPTHAASTHSPGRLSHQQVNSNGTGCPARAAGKHCRGQQSMFHRQDRRGKGRDRGVRRHGHTSLREHLATVVHLVDQMDARTTFRITGVDHGLVHSRSVHPLATVLRQQRRVHVDDPASHGGHDVARHEPEVSRQHQYIARRLAEDAPPLGAVAVVGEQVGRDPLFASPVQRRSRCDRRSPVLRRRSRRPRGRRRAR